MKTYIPILLVSSLLTLGVCAADYDNRPIPGTVQATSTKNNANINNTPRTNPTPNPEPASNPPGPQSDMHAPGELPPQ